MKTEWLEKWAKLLVNYSLNVKKGSVIKLRGSVAVAPLIAKVYEELLLAGAFSRVSAQLPGLNEIFFKTANKQQLSTLSPIDLYEAKKLDGIINIAGQTNTRELKAMFLDKKNPIDAWKKLSKNQQKLTNLLTKTKTVRILSADTDISLNVAGRKGINSDGKKNMPSGEVFTAPVENSANGFIRYSYPVVAYGREISGIRLEFSAGKVVKANADKNEPFLKKMLDTDKGARFLGELGIGTNYGIQKFISNILFDEKIGGSIHLAVGSSYEECGGKNKSALHWDMIKDLRDGGELYFDGKLIQKNGKFIAKSLVGLNKLN